MSVEIKSQGLGCYYHLLSFGQSLLVTSSIHLEFNNSIPPHTAFVFIVATWIDDDSSLYATETDSVRFKLQRNFLGRS